MRDHCSSRAVFDVELAQDVFDVLADGAIARTENDADGVIAFAF